MKNRFMNTFQDDIKKIDTKIIDLTWPGELFRYDEFKRIYSNAGRYTRVALQTLENENLTEQQKLIVALSMQNLSFHKFLDFALDVMDLYEQGKVSAQVLHWCVIPTYDWNTLIAEHYQHKEVHELLKRLVGLDGLDKALRRYVKDEVLTGKAKQNVEHLRNTGQIK